MKRSISNIAWPAAQDESMYLFLQQQGFEGLEIAPTRIFPDKPYDQLAEAKAFARHLKKTFGLAISSMQSICFGRDEAIFGTPSARQSIFDYIKQSIDFSEAIQCGNLVFGSPKNRIIGADQMDIAYEFFGKLGDYAASKNTVLAFEPNPEIYGTNFINTTQEAVDFVKTVNSPGLKVNFDLGTFLHNEEKIEIISDNLGIINHIHISEPYLEPIQHREIHKQISKILGQKQYDQFVSIEMKTPADNAVVKETVTYIKDTFHAA